MKKLFIIICFISFIGFTNANELHKITMDIYINRNGDAHIEEIWDMYTSSFTENYKPYYNLGESKISNFKVKDNYKTYEFQSNWNTKASFSQKAYKNGFNYINNGIEICWGISKYGENSYHLSYDISKMIVKSSDGYGIFYWQLIPYDMDPTADLYDITIRTDEYLPDTIDVWGYGAYGKMAYVNDGVVKLVGEDALDKSEYVVALIKFPGDMFETDYTDYRSFEDFLEMANEGSTSYITSKSSNTVENIIIFTMPVLFYIFTIVIIFLAIKNSGDSKYFKKLIFNDTPKKLPNDYPMYRDIPAKKDIYIAQYIARNYNIIKNDQNFIGCVILRWLKDGVISVDNSDKKESKIIFQSELIPHNYIVSDHESNLYKWMYEASKNGVLTTKDFKKYCRNHYSKILNWSPKNYEVGLNNCLNQGYIHKSEEKQNKYIVTYDFYNEGIKIAGLQKFLKAFSDMKNKEPIEVMLWQDYLIFAQMFGIAKKVAKQFKNLYPEVYDNTNYNYNTFIFINSFTSSGYAAASSARSAAQSYSSGGGGFSSGGGGGGSFGGGGGGGGSR